MERAETLTGLDGEGGACKTSGGRWSTAWRELRHQQVWVEKMEHARQVCVVVIHDTVNWLLV